jgi:hypothetical protein
MLRHITAVAVLLVASQTPLYGQNMSYTVTAASADVHEGPTIASPVIGKALRGEAFEITRNLGSWVRVPWPGAQDGSGYLHVSWGTISGQSRPSALIPSDAVSSAPTGLTQRRAAGNTNGNTTNGDLQPAPTPKPVSLPSHLVGVGGALGNGPRGFAATARAWSRDRFGVQIEIGQSTRTGAATHLRSAQFVQSLIYSLPNLVSNTFWVRPYVGSGINVYHSTLSSAIPGIADAVDSGFAYQVLGGAELTWANLPQVALSAGVRQQFAPHTPAAFDLGGFGVALSAHWYIR